MQYQYLNLNNDLLNLYTEKEHRIKLVLVFSFEQVWNDFYDERDSLLNLEYGYLR
ncbi:MAG: hypothetical protein GTN68_02345 [Candidatus Aminicenantes bacterium]|nr:hypothetical protein [Candidatus Aminicenantes bacterium]